MCRRDADLPRCHSLHCRFSAAAIMPLYFDAELVSALMFSGR